MIPVLYKFALDTDGSRMMLYLVALGLIAYAAWSGWRNALGPIDAKTGQPGNPTREERIRRAVMFGVIGTGLAALGLYYALPEVPILGMKGRGEGIPIHTYGVLVGGGFISAVTLSAWLAVREWPGPEGIKKRDQIFDLAFYVFIGGIVGSRELFVLVNYKKYSTSPNPAEAYGTILDLIVLAALIVGVVGRERFFQKDTARKLLENAFMIFIVTFLGGRVLFSLGKGGLGSLPDMLGGGLVFYGGLIGAALVALWYTKKEGIEFLRLADIAMPTVSLGQALGRLGCFSAGCCWGDVTTKAKAPFAVNFPGPNAMNLFGGLGGTPSLAYSSQVETTADQGGRYVVEATGLVTNGPVEGSVQIAQWASQHGHTLPVHPTQLYESLGQLCLLVALLTLRQYRRFHGQIFATWLMCYAVLRSTVELFRGDLERGTLHSMLEFFGLDGLASAVPFGAWYNISVSQFISICMFSLGAYILARNLRELKGRELDLKAAVAA